MNIKEKYIQIIEYGTYENIEATPEERKCNDKSQYTYLYHCGKLEDTILPFTEARLYIKCTNFPKNLRHIYIDHKYVTDELFQKSIGPIVILNYDTSLPLMNIHDHCEVALSFDVDIENIVASWSKITKEYIIMLDAKCDSIVKLPYFKKVTIEGCKFKKLLLHSETKMLTKSCSNGFDIVASCMIRVNDRYKY